MKKHINLIITLFCLFLFALPTLAQKQKPIKYPDREIKVLNDSIRALRGGTYVQLSQGMTHYELSGPTDGKIVVLIHGASLSMWVWDRQVKPLQEAGFQVLRYDHYGRGLSDYPYLSYDRELYRNQLMELLDTLHINKKVSIICHSFGGLVTSYFAATHPEKINKLIFISPGVTIGKLLKFVIQTPFSTLYVRSNLNGLDKSLEKRLMEQHIPLDPYESIYLDQVSNKGFEHSVISLFKDAIDNYLPYYNTIGTHKIPAIIIKGTKDEVLKEKHIQMAITAMPGSRYIPLEGVGHVPQFEATEQLNTILLDFLTKEEK
jgi:pimeloyl-ACP methyl ester carboxylesterase